MWTEILRAISPPQQFDECAFVYNTKWGIPQQSNRYDCGVYTCLYARCLVKLGPVVDKSCFLDARKSIVLSLYRERLIEVPEDGIVIAEYYAVHYHKKNTTLAEF